MEVSAGTWRGPWVLIVEDVRSLARAQRLLFLKWGIADVEIALDAGSARLAIERPGLVGALIDIVLHDENGIGLAVELRARQPRAEYLIWSGTTDMGLVRRAQSLDFDFVAKAPDQPLLRRAAARWASGASSAAPMKAAVERQLAAIRGHSKLTDAQAVALAHALELHTATEIASIRDVTTRAVELMSARIADRTGRTLAEWSSVMRDQLRAEAPTPSSPVLPRPPPSSPVLPRPPPSSPVLPRPPASSRVLPRPLRRR